MNDFIVVFAAFTLFYLIWSVTSAIIVVSSERREKRRSKYSDPNKPWNQHERMPH